MLQIRDDVPLAIQASLDVGRTRHWIACYSRLRNLLRALDIFGSPLRESTYLANSQNHQVELSVTTRPGNCRGFLFLTRD